jgi:predicted secreted Zn-dependent protease
MKCEFTIAMNQEEKLAGNIHKVSINVEKCDDATMLKYALKAYVVEIQSQIRNNWDQFIAGDYPKELVIGQAMFTSTRGKVTQKKAQEAYKAKVGQMSMVQKLRTLLDDGMIDVDMYEASIEKLFDKGEITQEELDGAMDI